MRCYCDGGAIGVNQRRDWPNIGPFEAAWRGVAGVVPCRGRARTFSAIALCDANPKMRTLLMCFSPFVPGEAARDTARTACMPPPSRQRRGPGLIYRWGWRRSAGASRSAARCIWATYSGQRRDMRQAAPGVDAPRGTARGAWCARHDAPRCAATGCSVDESDSSRRPCSCYSRSSATCSSVRCAARVVALGDFSTFWIEAARRWPACIVQARRGHGLHR